MKVLPDTGQKKSISVLHVGFKGGMVAEDAKGSVAALNPEKESPGSRNRAGALSTRLVPRRERLRGLLDDGLMPSAPPAGAGVTLSPMVVRP
jgi:hypothetical protein